MDRVESSGNEISTPRIALDVKRKRKKRRKAQPDDGDDVCAICDDGGYVTCCDGGCMRSFHLTEEHGQGSKCPSLGINSEQAKIIIDTKDFICKNCKYKQHQCSACGLLGSSDLSLGAEVFQCKDYECGHFYHPKCVSKLLYPNDKLRACHFEQYVATGLKFLCHVHKCSVCHEEENRDDKNMQFALCRLCPTTYHRKCLPSDIPFEAKEGINGYIFQRAWDGILHDRILIYCMKHEIVKELGIPRRKHIIFPSAKNLCLCQKVLKVHPRNKIHWPKKICLTTHHLNHLSVCHPQLPRISASAPILWTHLHQNPCFLIHIQVHVVGLMIDHVASLTRCPLYNTNRSRTVAKSKRHR